MFAGASFAEEGVKGVIATADGLVGRHLAVGLNAMLKAVKLPAGVTDLDSSLADVYGDALTLLKERRVIFDNLYTKGANTHFKKNIGLVKV